MAKELCLEEGVNEAIGIFERVSERPILVAVYGWPDSGKSYLIDRLGDYFKSKGMSAARSGGGPTLDTFELLRCEPEYLREVQLFHCGWTRVGKGSLRDYEDPNVLAQVVANRRVHLNIGMYNPAFYQKPTGEYDLIISNPGSTHKNGNS